MERFSCIPCVPNEAIHSRTLSVCANKLKVFISTKSRSNPKIGRNLRVVFCSKEFSGQLLCEYFSFVFALIFDLLAFDMKNKNKHAF